MPSPVLAPKGRNPDHPGTTHVLGDRHLADACCLAHLTDAEPTSSCVSRSTSRIFLIDILFPAIDSPCCSLTGTADLLIRMSTGGLSNAHQQLSAITGTLPAMRRNDCPRWTGIGNAVKLLAAAGQGCGATARGVAAPT
jgi:hypothetical protein